MPEDQHAEQPGQPVEPEHEIEAERRNPGDSLDGDAGVSNLGEPDAEPEQAHERRHAGDGRCAIPRARRQQGQRQGHDREKQQEGGQGHAESGT